MVNPNPCFFTLGELSFSKGQIGEQAEQGIVLSVFGRQTRLSPQLLLVLSLVLAKNWTMSLCSVLSTTKWRYSGIHNSVQRRERRRALTQLEFSIFGGLWANLIQSCLRFWGKAFDIWSAGARQHSIRYFMYIHMWKPGIYRVFSASVNPVAFLAVAE